MAAGTKQCERMASYRRFMALCGTELPYEEEEGGHQQRIAMDKVKLLEEVAQVCLTENCNSVSLMQLWSTGHY